MGCKHTHTRSSLEIGGQYVCFPFFKKQAIFICLSGSERCLPLAIFFTAPPPIYLFIETGFPYVVLAGLEFVGLT